MYFTLKCHVFLVKYCFIMHKHLLMWKIPVKCCILRCYSGCDCFKWLNLHTLISNKIQISSWMYKIDHLILVPYFTGKLWILSFMCVPLDTNHPNTLTDLVHSPMALAHSDIGPPSKTVRAATTQKLLRSCQRNLTKGSKCLPCPTCHTVPE